jgi:hypothetical protein
VAGTLSRTGGAPTFRGTVYPALRVVTVELREADGSVDLTPHVGTLSVTGQPFELVVE